MTDTGLPACKWLVCLSLLTLSIYVHPAWSADTVDMKALMTTYCVDCHGGTKTKAGLDLSGFKGTKAEAIAQHQLWRHIRELVADDEMPPKPPLFKAKERLAFLNWIDDTLKGADWSALAQAGHVPLGRLTKSEYQRSVAALFALPSYTSARIRMDGQGGSGFTNDRADLFISEADLEAYLAVAEELTQQAVVRGRGPQRFHFEAEKMMMTEKRRTPSTWGWPLSAGQMTAYDTIEIPADGTYRITLSALPAPYKWVSGYQVGIARKRVSQDLIVGWGRTGTDVPAFIKKEFLVTIRAGTHEITVNTIMEDQVKKLTAAQKLKAPAKPTDWLPPPKKKKKKRRSKAKRYEPLWFDAITVEGPLPTEHKAIVDLHPKLTRAEAPALINRFLSHAFRRPATADENQRYLTIFNAAYASTKAVDEALASAFSAALISPHFLYQVEQTDADGWLNSWQLAARLSSMLWQSSPDKALHDAAAQKALRTPEQLTKTLDRMLADQQSQYFAKAFIEQWLGTAALGVTIHPDKTKYAAINNELLNIMKEEPWRFFHHLITEDISLLTLLDGTYSISHQRLARLNGSKVRFAGWQKHNTEGPRQGLGLLGMRAVLTATSMPLRTSPVIRGNWIYETILGKHLPPPPANVDEIPDDAGEKGKKTLKHILEEHRSKPACASCHAKIDPLGFALEHFDAIGNYRKAYPSGAIDSAAELADGSRFTGASGLRDYLLSQKQAFADNLSRRMLAFALGRKLAYHDEALIRSLTTCLIDNDFRPRPWLHALVSSEAFRRQVIPKEVPHD